MIEGIEVLNKSQIVELSETGTTLLSISIILVFVTIILIMITLSTESIVIGIFTIISFVSFIVIGYIGSNNKIETDRYEYQCTISDNILFMDMYEKYEVVSKDGELWTIRDKEVENE
jgi:hypothetical protein